MQNLTVQKVFLFLITVGTVLAAPWFTAETLGGNPIPLLALTGTGAFLLLVYGLGDRSWLLIPFFLSVDGNLNFLPLNFSLQELAILIVLGFMVFRMIFGLDLGWRLGPAVLWIPVALLLSLTIYHWISSGDIGIRQLGGTSWGGRKYFKVLIASLAIPLLASHPGITWRDLQKVPLVYVLGGLIDVVPDLLTTFIPQTAPLIFKFYSGVNISEYGSVLRGNFGQVGITRAGTLAKIGTGIGLVTLCYIPIQKWLSPTKIWVVPMLVLGFVLSAISGFRSYVFKYVVAVFSAIFSTARFRIFIIIPILVPLFLAVALSQKRIFEYPLAMQRALSFLPGEWDPKAKSETDGSSKWREDIRRLFYKEYFPKAPWLGVGYHFDPMYAQRETDVYLRVAQLQETNDEFLLVRNFIETRQPHEGPVSILLCFGIIGMVFFFGYCVSITIYSFRSVMRTPQKDVAPIQIWALAILNLNILSFFLVFGDLIHFMIAVCPVITLLYRAEGLRPKNFIDAGNQVSPAGDHMAQEGSPLISPVPILNSRNHYFN